MSPTSLVVQGGTLVLPDSLLEQGALVCQAGRIVAVGSEQELEGTFPPEAEHVHAGGGYIAPGFVDQHVHGALGRDFMDGDADSVRTAIRGHTRHGTTSIFPTTTTGTPRQIAEMLAACEQVQRDWQPGDHAHLAGVHLYGPYFASDKIGAHPRGYERNPDPREYLAAFERGIIKVATCAAELPGAEDFYRAATAAGCLATCGHSNSSWTEMRKAYEAGMRHVDHFWCAMSNVRSVRDRFQEPMQGSMAEFVLMYPEMSTEVIADGCHLSPELLEFAYRMKGVERLCLVTDCNRALGMPPGEYIIGPRDTGEPLLSDGRVGRMPSGTGLASSVVGMDHMVRTMVEQTTAGVAHAVRMASLTPAQRTGIAHEVGSLEVGKRADLVILSSDLRAQRVFTAGVECHFN